MPRLGLGFGLARVHAGASAPPTPLALDLLTGVIAGVDVQYIKAGYSGPTVLGYRLADADEQALYPDAGRLYTLAGDLWSVWAPGGAACKTLYDQSGAAKNATQTTASKMPTLLDVGGETVLNFTRAAVQYLTFGTALGKPANYTTICRWQIDDLVRSLIHGSTNSLGQSFHIWAHTEVRADGFLGYQFGDGTNYREGKSNVFAPATATWYVHTHLYGGGAAETQKIDGVAITLVDVPGGTATSVAGAAQEYCLGRSGAFNSLYFDGKMTGFIACNAVN